MLTSLCKELWQFILCQGILAGVMNGLIYTPAISIVGHYFHKRCVLAMAIVSSGSSLGGVIFPIMLDRMLLYTSLGFSWSVREVGFLILALAIAASLTIRPHVAPRSGPVFLPHAFLKPAYHFQAAGIFVVLLGLFTSLFCLPSYASHQGTSRDLAFYTLSMLNATSLFGRLFAGFYARRLGPFNMLIFAAVTASILCFCWIRIKSDAAIIPFSVFYGPPSGAIVALLPAALAQVAPEPNQIGTYFGMAFGIYSIPALAGTPIAGVMISTYDSYEQAAIFSGAVLIAGAILLAFARQNYVERGQWCA